MIMSNKEIKQMIDSWKKDLIGSLDYIEAEKNRKLYMISYKSWKMDFSGTYSNSMLSTGLNEEQAIDLVKNKVDGDCMDFKATIIDNVMGYKIRFE